jgi:hypothetical protein
MSVFVLELHMTDSFGYGVHEVCYVDDCMVKVNLILPVRAHWMHDKSVVSTHWMCDLSGICHKFL